MTPLALGTHANVVYVYNQGRGNTPHPLAGFLKRYDRTSGKETTILTTPQASLDQAQVSADGQWVVFSTQQENHSALQLVRMDGQGRQTLYCAAPNEVIGSLAWSPDQRTLAFQEGQNVSLLTLATGAYQQVVHPYANSYAVTRTWLDSTRLYLAILMVGTETPPLNLALLDIRTGNVQPVLRSPTLCGDFDRSLDGARLFTSECQVAMPITSGPSSIFVQAARGGPATTVYQTPSEAITALRVASPTTLVFIIQNTSAGSLDTGHNGVWKVNTDGKGLVQLLGETPGESASFSFVRTPWSTISRDGVSYAVQVFHYSASTPGTIQPLRSTSLLLGSLSGGQPTAFATLTATAGTIDTLDIAGWTTM